MVTVIAAVLVTLQTTLNLDNRAAAHRAAGAAYGKLRRRFEVFLLDRTSPATEVDPREALKRLIEEMDQLGESSPLIPPAADRAAWSSSRSEPNQAIEPQRD
jgi:hypothetical protein